MEQRERHDQVVDLTGPEESKFTNSAAALSPRRRKRTTSSNEESTIHRPQSNPADAETEIEVISVKKNKRANPTRNARRPPRSSSPNADDDLDVIDEKHITPQERLRRIQEQHARGEVVRTGAAEEPRSYPLFGLEGRRGIMGPRAFHPYLMPPQTGFQGFNFMRGDVIPFRMFNSNMANNLEQDIMERTMQASMNDTSGKILDPKSLMLPAVPSPEARPGFTRNLNFEGDLVCIRCDHTLGAPGEGMTASAKLRSQQVFARGCGHVYCGHCTFAMKDRTNKDKACPVAECKSLSPKKRGLFREVFL